jgi:hypothetical protein
MQTAPLIHSFVVDEGDTTNFESSAGRNARRVRGGLKRNFVLSTQAAKYAAWIGHSASRENEK